MSNEIAILSMGKCQVRVGKYILCAFGLQCLVGTNLSEYHQSNKTVVQNTHLIDTSWPIFIFDIKQIYVIFLPMFRCFLTTFSRELQHYKNLKTR